MEFRIRETGEILSEQKFRQSQDNVSMPEVIDQAYAEQYGADIVAETQVPATGPFQVATSEVVDIDGVWTKVWTVAYEDVVSIQNQLKDKVTARRFEIETGGIDLPGGVHVNTGIDDQNRINSVLTNAARAGLTSIRFKAASGWVQMTLTELEGIANAITLHVQACYNAEFDHHKDIDDLEDPELLAAYDISEGWPSPEIE